MKLIPLTQGKFAQVDDNDYEWLNQWKWCADKGRNTFYALRCSYENGKRETLRMHHVIMQSVNGVIIDHRDRNGLNNQRHNLRKCNNTQNNANRQACGASKYLGVGIVSNGINKGQITAQIHQNKKKIFLGNFKTEELAAKAYDKKALELYGEFANLNFK